MYIRDDDEKFTTDQVCEGGRSLSLSTQGRHRPLQCFLSDSAAGVSQVVGRGGARLHPPEASPNTWSVVPSYSGQTWACSLRPGSAHLKTIASVAFCTSATQSPLPTQHPLKKIRKTKKNAPRPSWDANWSSPPSVSSSSPTEAVKGTEKSSAVEPGLISTTDQCIFLVLRCMYIFIMDFEDFL